MKTNVRLSLMAILFIQCSMILAKTNITTKNQGFRENDILIKQQIEFKDPGRNGENVVWDFSRLESFDENYKVRYFVPAVKKPDTLFITNIEHQTMYKYILTNDSLLLTGFENSGSRMNFENPQLTLSYPFKFQDSISKCFSGKGIYMDMLNVEASGTSYTVADATGTIILPNEDTISNVLRIRLQQEYIQKTYPKEYSPQIKYTNDDSASIVAIDSARITNTDTIYLRTETYRWYAPGYRYPVFETISNHSHLPKDTTEIEDISTAFYFPSFKHDYLNSDPDNLAVLDSLSSAKKDKESPKKLLFDYNYYPNPVRTHLNIELLLDLPSNVTFRIYNTAGNLEFTQQEGSCTAGLHYFTLNMSNLSLGHHILYFIVNEQEAQTLIIKL